MSQLAARRRRTVAVIGSITLGIILAAIPVAIHSHRERQRARAARRAAVTSSLQRLARLNNLTNASVSHALSIIGDQEGGELPEGLGTFLVKRVSGTNPNSVVVTVTLTEPTPITAYLLRDEFGDPTPVVPRRCGQWQANLAWKFKVRAGVLVLYCVLDESHIDDLLVCAEITSDGE